MDIDDIKDLEPPFKVRSVHHPRNIAVVTGYSQNDPLGVGGGLLPDMPTVYFKGGGWLLLKDLLEHWELVTRTQPEQR
jgi:hypothetical protein